MFVDHTYTLTPVCTCIHIHLGEENMVLNPSKPRGKQTYMVYFVLLLLLNACGRVADVMIFTFVSLMPVCIFTLFSYFTFAISKGSGYGYGTVPGGRWAIDTEGGHVVVSVSLIRELAMNTEGGHVVDSVSHDSGYLFMITSWNKIGINIGDWNLIGRWKLTPYDMIKLYLPWVGLSECSTI